MKKKKNKIPRPKQTYTPKLRYETLEDALYVFIQRHCVPATTWEEHSPSYKAAEIRVVINDNGGGYMHLLGQDSDTIDFKTI